MSLRLTVLLASALACGPVSCASLNGFDPNKPVHDQPSAAPDPEVEPLQPSPKLLMRDPRGIALVAAPPKATVPMTPPPPPADSAPAVAAKCGTKADPCPMQHFMHVELSTAHTADRLTTAFTLLAGMSPDPAWAWTAIATRGAERAIAGDIPAAKAQCAACHDSYREAYKARHRARAL